MSPNLIQPPEMLNPLEIFFGCVPESRHPVKLVAANLVRAYIQDKCREFFSNFLKIDSI